MVISKGDYMVIIKGIDIVIDKVGSQTALARELGVLPQAVQKWVMHGYVPLSRVKEIADKYEVDPFSLINPELLTLLKDITYNVKSSIDEV